MRHVSQAWVTAGRQAGFLRLGSTLALGVALVACADTTGRVRGNRTALDEARRPSVAWVRAVGCCEDAPRARLAAQVRQRISVRASRVSVTATDEGLQDNAILAQRAARRVQRLLSQARKLYVGMRMQAALGRLRQAEAEARRSAAMGVGPDNLAMIHLWMVAVYHALDDRDRLREYSRAAVRYDPGIKPDPAIFSPPVRAAIDEARAATKTAAVTIRSDPPAAQVLWDGAEVGQTPTTVPNQVTGSHFLVLVHPLRQRWAQEIVISTDAALQIKLEQRKSTGPSPASQPGLASQPTTADRTIVVRRHGGGLVLRSTALAGETSNVVIGTSAQPAEIDAAADSLLSPALRNVDEPPPRDNRADMRAAAPSHWRRYWWAWALAGAAVVAAGVTTAVVVSDSGDTTARGFRMPLPSSP